MIALATHRHTASSPANSPRFSGPMAAITCDFAALALEYVETAVFALDRDARIQYASAAARQLLEDGRFCNRNGVLSSSVGSEAMTLRRAVRECADAAEQGPAEMSFHRFDDAGDVLCLGMVAVRPRDGAEADRPFVMVFAAKPSGAHLPDCRQLRTHFGLTDAQAKLAVEIAKGEGLKACTRRLGIAMTTGRSHLRQIFVKTDTKRQAELVRLITSCRFSAPRAGASA